MRFEIWDLRFLISACGDFSFFVSYAYFVWRYLVFALPIVLVLFMQSQYMNLLYLHAFPLDFLRYDVIINGSIFMSELLFGLCFRFCFKQNPQVFVLNKCILWLQSRSCFRAIFSFLTLSSVFITRGLISLIFLSPPDVIYSLFCGSKAEIVLRQFLVTWPCRACLRTRDLLLPYFITPRSC